jgi:hypothetical protein
MSDLTVFQMDSMPLSLKKKEKGIRSEGRLVPADRKIWKYLAVWVN